MKRKTLFLSFLLIMVLFISTSCTENVQPTGTNENEPTGKDTETGETETNEPEKEPEEAPDEPPAPIVPSYGPVELPKHSF